MSQDYSLNDYDMFKFNTIKINDDSDDSEFECNVQKSSTLIDFESDMGEDLLVEKQKGEYIIFYTRLLNYISDNNTRKSISTILSDLQSEKYVFKLQPISTHGYKSNILIDINDIPKEYKNARLWINDKEVHATVYKRNNFYQLKIGDENLTYNELYIRLELKKISSVNIELY